MAEAQVIEILSSSEGSDDADVGYVPIRTNRKFLLLLDSEGHRCRRAALLDISGDVRASRIFRGEDRGTTIAHTRSEYEALGWVRTSLLWPGTRRIRMVRDAAAQ